MVNATSNSQSRLNRCGNATCTALLKTLLFFFNIVFFALGISLVFLGCYGLKDFHSFFTFAASSSVWVAFLAIGLFILCIAVLSFWCIPKGVSWLLNLYGIVVFLLFVAVLCSSSAFMIKREALEHTIQTGFANQMNNYQDDKRSIDLVQESVKCCGLMNYTDWFSTPWADNRQRVPLSCCIDQAKCVHENLNTLNTTDIWTTGCYSKVNTLIEDEYSLIGGIGFTFALIILFGSVLSWWLAKNIRSSQNRYEEMH